MAKRGAVLAVAITECERFLSRAKSFVPSDSYLDDDPRGRAAAKRASMDLTHALADLRKAASSDWSV